ncbi:MAG: hypothetical protein ACPGVG_12605 [Mycobacterium sp.]
MRIGIGIGIPSTVGGVAITAPDRPLWYREDIGLAPTSGTLTAWANQGTFGGAVTAGGSPPTNGATGVVFTASAPNVSLATAASNILATDAWTAVCVVNPVSNANVATNQWQRTSFLCDDDGAWGIFARNGGGSDIRLTAYQWDGSAPRGAESVISRDSRYIVFAWFDGTNVNLHVDGESAATPVASDPIASLAGNARIGNRGSDVSAGAFETRLEEAITWQRSLSSEERTAVIAELTERHGL